MKVLLACILLALVSACGGEDFASSSAGGSGGRSGSGGTHGDAGGGTGGDGGSAGQAGASGGSGPSGGTGGAGTGGGSSGTGGGSGGTQAGGSGGSGTGGGPAGSGGTSTGGGHAGSGGSGGDPCPPDEASDTLEGAAQLPRQCTHSIAGSVQNAIDEDWFEAFVSPAYTPNCWSLDKTVTLFAPANPALVYGLYAECDGMGEPTVSCSPGPRIEYDWHTFGCETSSGQISMTVSCGTGEVLLYPMVKATGSFTTCEAYTLDMTIE